MSKKRGLPLTLMIFLVAFGYLKYLYLPFDQELVISIFGLYPSWFTTWSLLALLIGIPTIIGLWKWKKWSIYLFAFTAIIGFLFNNFVFNLTLWANIGYYITLSLFTLTVVRKWKYFS